MGAGSDNQSVDVRAGGGLQSWRCTTEFDRRSGHTRELLVGEAELVPAEFILVMEVGTEKSGSSPLRLHGMPASSSSGSGCSSTDGMTFRQMFDVGQTSRQIPSSASRRTSCGVFDGTYPVLDAVGAQSVECAPDAVCAVELFPCADTTTGRTGELRRTVRESFRRVSRLVVGKPETHHALAGVGGGEHCLLHRYAEGLGAIYGHERPYARADLAGSAALVEPDLQDFGVVSRTCPGGEWGVPAISNHTRTRCSCVFDDLANKAA